MSKKRERVDRSIIIKIDAPKPIPSKEDKDEKAPKKVKVTPKSTSKVIESHWSEWKNVFLVGTEWGIYDQTYSVNWDFDHLFDKLKNKEFKGKYVYIFGSTEPQLVTIEGKETNAPIPTLVAVVGDIPAPSLIGITSVQRQNEEILPFEEMKLSWQPFVSKNPELKHLNNVYILNCYARKTLVSKMKEEAQKKYDYCMPYIFFPDRKDDTEYGSELMIQATINGRGISFDYDYKMDDIEEIVKEQKEENELDDQGAKLIEEAIKSEIAATKLKYKNMKETREKKIAQFSEDDRKAIQGLKFYKFYPQNKEIDLSSLKSPYINRYYGKATEIL